jgi:4'-phosphopantetheinyl transferase
MPIDFQLGRGLFTEQEYQYIVSEQKNPASAFYEIWTLKESYVKAHGKGLTIPFHTFNVNIRSLDDITITDVGTGKVDVKYICKQYKFNHHYKLSVCAQNADICQFKKDPTFVSFHNICDIL